MTRSDTCVDGQNPTGRNPERLKALLQIPSHENPIFADVLDPNIIRPLVKVVKKLL